MSNFDSVESVRELREELKAKVALMSESEKEQYFQKSSKEVLELLNLSESDVLPWDSL